MIQLSVIVTTYNRPKFLKETLNSILRQTYVDFELIVVDNYSNYDFFKTISTFNDSRIKAYQNDNHGIIASNRNFGIKKAVGEYVAFCDDDDIWLDNKLELQIDRILTNKVDFISSNALLFKDNIENIISITNSKLPLNYNAFLKVNHVNTSTVIAKKSALLNFDESSDLVTIEDYELWLKLYDNSYKFAFISDPLIYYRLSDNNISLKNYSKKHIRLVFLFRRIFMRSSSRRTRFILIKIIMVNCLKYIVKKLIILRKT